MMITIASKYYMCCNMDYNTNNINVIFKKGMKGVCFSTIFLSENDIN